jgi:hypothetical protein
MEKGEGMIHGERRRRDTEKEEENIVKKTYAGGDAGSKGLEGDKGVGRLAELGDTTEGSVREAQVAHQGKQLSVDVQGSLRDLIDMSGIDDGEVKNIDLDAELSKLRESYKAKVQLYNIVSKKNEEMV